MPPYLRPRVDNRARKTATPATSCVVHKPLRSEWPGGYGPACARAGLMRVNGSVVLGQTRILVAAGG